MHYRKFIFWGIQALLFIGFIIISLGLVFSNGICCGDDSYHAIIAKNIVNGFGYNSTVLASRVIFEPSKFDPYVGTGPTVNLSTALVILITGNKYWAPGLSIVLLWSTILILIRWLLAYLNLEQSWITITIAIFVIFSFLFLAYHFEHWYALFGEIPAALFIILAILIYFGKNSTKFIFLSGLFFSLAFLAKYLSLIAFGAFLISITIQEVFSRKTNLKKAIKVIINDGLLIFSGFSIPFLSFELWKLKNLGFSGYINHYNNFLIFLSTKGASDQAVGISQFLERLETINTRFGILFPVILIVLMGFGYLLRKDKTLFPVYAASFSIIILHSIYWFFFSIGLARYYVICVIIIIFCLSLPFLSKQLTNRSKYYLLIILAVLSIYNISTINVKYPFENVKLFTPTPYTNSVIQMTNILSNQQDKKPFITQWWATAADLEYMLDTPLNFTTFRDPKAIHNDEPFIVIANSKFILDYDKDFLSLLERCNTSKVGQFIYGICQPGSIPLE